MATTERGPASLLDPHAIRALMTGEASRNETMHFVRTVIQMFEWRAEECRELGRWADAEETDATIDALRRQIPAPDPAQIAVALTADPWGGAGSPSALVQRIAGTLPPVRIAR